MPMMNRLSSLSINRSSSLYHKRILGGVMMAILSVFMEVTSHGYFEPSEDTGKIQQMNDISMDQYPEFEKNWKLVTVRYREDSGELRFVYANDLAYQSMQELNPKYPEGSVFAKIGLLSEDDPSFPSSKVPSGTKRYQFMVKDSKKYPSTDGWGYALFDGEGRLFNEDLATKTQGCVACHRIVPERDFVFSRRMVLGQTNYDQRMDPNLKVHSSSDKKSKEISPPISPISFKQVARTTLPQSVVSLLQKYDVAYAISGGLQNSIFSGTLDEIVPLLAKKASQLQAPTLLLANKKNFSLVLPTNKGKSCKNPRQTSLLIHITYNSKPVRHTEICL